MSDPVWVALITLVGGGGFATIVVALLARRKTAAEADLTVGGAWELFVKRQDQKIEKVEREAQELRGQLDAANKRINILERQRNESLFWQAQVTTRETVIASLLADAGIPVPPMPAPPVMREPHTRAGDQPE